jgi:hypothetical protein
MTDLYIMELPEHIVNKIMLYVSHPVADLFKQEFIWELEWFNDGTNNFYKAWRINNCDFNESEDEDYQEDICFVCNHRMTFEDYCEDFVCWNETCRRNPENQPERQYRSTIDDNSSDDELLRPRQTHYNSSDDDDDLI